jgi:hypothetical protein
MIEEPGSFSGRDNSPSPLLGPDPKNLISFAIFMRDTARVFRDPLKWTKASLQARDSNLFEAGLKSNPVSFFKLSATF